MIKRYLYIIIAGIILSGVGVPQAGTLGQVRDSLSTYASGSMATHFIRFTNQIAISPKGTIVFYFPDSAVTGKPEFTFTAGSVIAAFGDVTHPSIPLVRGGFSQIQVVNDSIRCIRDNTGSDIPMGSTVNIILALIRNPRAQHLDAKMSIKVYKSQPGQPDYELMDSGVSAPYHIDGPATSFSVTTVPQQAAGVPFALKITGARDAYAHPAGGKIAVSAFSGGGPSPQGNLALLDSISLRDGTGSANQILFNAETGVVLRCASSLHTQNTNTFNVAPGVARQLTIAGEPTTITSGVPFSSDITVSARDNFGNIATPYANTVSFYSSDASAVLPATTTLIAGQRTYAGGAFSLRSAGLHKIWVTDGTLSNATGTIVVTPGPISSFILSVPGTVTAGVAATLTVSGAVDAAGNSASGTVNVAFTDGQPHAAPNGTLPVFSQIQAVNGVGTGSATFFKAETGVRLRGSVNAVTDDTEAFTILPGAVGGLTVTSKNPLPAWIGAGNSLSAIDSLIVDIQDAFGNRKTDFTGLLTFSSNDPLASLPEAYIYSPGDNGRHRFSGNAFTFRSAGNQTITVQTGAFSQKSDAVRVVSGAMTSFALNVGAVQQAGIVFPLQVYNARDAWGNPATGTIEVQALSGGSDAPNGQSPVFTPIPVVAGSGQAHQTLVRVEVVRLIGAVRSGETIIHADTTETITVSAGPLGKMQLNGVPATVPLNTPFNNDIIVRFFDSFGNSLAHTGTIRFGSTDASAALPGDDTFASATQRTYSGALFMLVTPGMQKISVRDLGAVPVVSDSSGQIDVSAVVISRVRADMVKVSLGQSNIPVTMEIQNWGTLPLQSVTGLLKFSNGNYIASGPAAPVTIPARTVSGPGTGQLVFYVTVRSNTTPGISTMIDASLSATYSGSPISIDGAAAGGTHTWLVQSEANLMIKKVDVLADTVQQGQQNITMEVEVQNGTDLTYANAIIQSTSFQFRLDNMTDVTDSFRVVREVTNPAVITGLQTAKLKFYLKSSTKAPQGYIFVDPTIQYVEGNTTTTKFALTAMPDLFYSIEAGSLQIQEIRSSQPTVTQNQTTPWQVIVDVKNTGAFPITVNFNPSQTFIRFRRAGTDYSGQFTIEMPGAFSDGTANLPDGEVKSIVYTIHETTPQAGTFSIFSRVQTLEGLITSDAFGSVEVQTSEEMNIARVQSSQNTVTANDTTYPWHIDVLLSNQGGSAVEIDTVLSTLRFGGSDTFSLARPKLLQYGTVLRGGQSDTLRFPVLRSGETPGDVTIDATVYYYNLNSGKPDSIKTNPSARGMVTLQNPANGYISSIRATPRALTQGGTAPWRVTLHLDSQVNAGDILLNLEHADSTTVRLFRDGIWQSDYVLQRPANLAGNGTRLLRAGVPDSLLFTGMSMGAEAGVMQIEARVVGTEVNRNRHVRLANLAPAAAVTVQTPANLSVLPNSLEPSYVSGGAFYRFQMNVINAGGSALILDPLGTVFSFSDGAITYTTLLDAALATSIPALASTTLQFNIKELPPDFRMGRYTPQLTIAGAQNGNPFSQTINLVDNAVTIGAPREVMITALRSMAPTVTAGQTKPWTIELDVMDNGSATLQLDSTRISFLRDAQDISHRFQISYPDTFTNGTPLIRGFSAAEIHYLVTGVDEATEPGPITIAARLWLSDSAQTHRKFDEQTSQGNAGYVVVQSPADLQLRAFRASQYSVSRGQTTPWHISTRVENAGGSQVTLDLAQTQIRFSNGDSFYTVQPPPAFSGSNDLVLAPGKSDSLRWTILSVREDPAVLGPVAIDVHIQAVENNSDRLVVVDSQPAGQTVTVLVQDSAKVRIDSVRAVLPRETLANSGQPFYIQAKVTNPGEGDAIRKVRIGWASDGFILFPNGQEVEIDLIPASSSKWTEPGLLVQAGSTANVFDTITARIVSSLAQNTGQSAQHLPSLKVEDYTTVIGIQQPGALQIVGMSTSRDTIPAGYTKPWSVFVDVANSGQGLLVLEPPAGGDITLRPGFAVTPPLLSAEERLLPFGDVRRLAYVVTVSGAGSGILPVTARIKATDGNDPTRLLTPQVGQTQVHLSTSARVQIAQTFVDANLLNVDEQGTAHVNTKQQLQVRVRVENIGGQGLDSVYVRLRSARSKISGGNPQVITNLGTGSSDYFRMLSFEVEADSLQNLAGEMLIADIPRAVGEDQSLANAALSPDSAVVLKIYKPAELRLTNTRAVTPNVDRRVSYDQSFPVEVTVHNIGSEAVDSVKVHLSATPAGGVTFAATDLIIPKRIAAGDTGRIVFTTRAGKISGQVTISADIRSSKGVNEGKSAPINRVGQDSSTTVTIEEPAQLRILAVAAPADVTAGDNQNDWRIYVKVINDGVADLKFENISPANITFTTQGSVDTYYQVNAPAKLINTPGLILSGGRQDSLLYIVTQIGKIAGTAEIRVHLQASDVNRAAGTDNLMTATGTTTMAVNSSSWVRIRVTNALAKNQDDLGRAIVNRGRLAEIKVEAETSEITGVDSVRIELSATGASSVIQPILTIPHIGAGSRDSVKFQIVTDDSWDAALGERLETWSARILSANSEGSALGAQVREPVRPIDAIALMRIQNPAKIDIQLSRRPGQDSVLTADQVFSVYVKLTNLGTAGVANGKIRLLLPAGKGYTLVSGELERDFAIPLGQKSALDSFRLRAPINNSYLDPITVQISQIPQDLNEGLAAAVEKQQATLIYSTLQSDLRLTLSIYSPKGAQDGEISTGQQFVLRAICGATSNIQNKSVRIVMPTAAGFSLLSDEVQTLEANLDTLFWRIQAPENESAIAREFMAVARGLSADGWQTVQHSVTISKVIERASLYLDFLVVSLPVEGVMENGQANFSTDQFATLKTVVTNQGAAKVNRTGKVTLHLQESGLRFNGSDSVQTFTVGTNITWNVRASGSAILDSRAITAEITAAPADTNTNVPANIGKGISSLNVRTEPRGAVQLKNFYISSPLGAMDRTVSAGQSFELTAVITSTSAKELQAEIGYTGGFQTNNPSVAVPVGPNQIVRWSMIAPPEPAVNNTISLTVSAKDYRSGTNIVPNNTSSISVTTQPRTKYNFLARITAPRGLTNMISSNSAFQLALYINHQSGTAAPEPDDLTQVQLYVPAAFLAAGETLVKSGRDSLVWNLKSPTARQDTLFDVWFNVLDLPRDGNSGLAATTDFSRISYPIYVVKRARVALHAQINDQLPAVPVAVRIGNEFDLTATLQNLGTAEYTGSYKVTLRLPSGYRTASPLVVTTTGKQTVWKIKAPDSVSPVADTLVVKLNTPPKDILSGTDAEVAIDSAIVLVQPEAGSMVIKSYAIKSSSVALRGGKAIPMLGLSLQNRDKSTGTKSILDTVRVSFRNRNGESVPARSVVSRLAAHVHGNPEQIVAENSAPGNSAEMILNFYGAGADTIRDAEPFRIDLVVDIAATARITDFTVNVDSAAAIIARDAVYLSRLHMVDSTLSPVHYLGFTSGTMVIVEDALNESFCNYPNPFGTSARPRTRFVYYLKQASDIQLKIFTLTGDLVYALEFTKAAHPQQTRAGVHQDDIIWDGRNGRGDLVMNGVYLAYLKTEDGTVAVTKIAVIK